jgi:hypothetical protein
MLHSVFGKPLATPTLLPGYANVLEQALRPVSFIYVFREAAVRPSAVLAQSTQLVTFDARMVCWPSIRDQQQQRAFR